MSQCGPAGEARPSAGDPDDLQVARVLDAYLADLEAGRPTDPDRLLADHPQIADRLRACLEVMQLADRLTDQPEAEHDALEGLAGHGVRLGDYRILRQIGRGGMGVVYEAEQVSLGRRVALKVLPFLAALDPQQMARFRTEVQAAAQLHHTNIVPVFSVGCERGMHFYAMQFIGGQTLAELIREVKRLEGVGYEQREEGDCRDSGLAHALFTGCHAQADAAVGDAVQSRGESARPSDSPSPTTSATPTPGASTRGRAYFRSVAGLGIQAAEALDHAHRLGVVHRDVKPANLLVDLRGNLWVTDFGLALLRGAAGLTRTGDLVGTLRYMSPEQALAQRILLDYRTDIYSLGATLYELLTLHPAFGGDDSQELLRQIAHEEPSPMRRWGVAIPRELETITLKAMSKEPASRYATAQELADDLRRFLDDKPIRARRPTLLDRMAKWSRRHPAAVVAALTVLALAATALATTTVLVRREREEVARQRDAAEAQRRWARRAVDQMYSRVAREWLAGRPKLEPIQREFLEEALGYYQEFARERGTDPEVRLETARALQRVGDIRQKLGDFKGSESAYQQALDLARGLATRFPAEPEYRDDLAQIENNLGAVLLSSGRVDEALAAFRDSLKLKESLAAELPEQRKYRELAMSGLSNLAVVLFQTGRPREAEQAFRRALEHGERLVADAPAASGSPPTEDIRVKVAGLHHNLGAFLTRSKRPKDAEPISRRAVELYNEALEQSPLDPELQFQTAWSLSNLGIVMFEIGQLADAEANFRRAAAIHGGLVSQYPGVIRYREQLANDQFNLGQVLVKFKGRHADAVVAFQMALELRETLVAEVPDASEYREDLATSLLLLTEVLGDSTDPHVRDPRAAVEFGERAVRLKPDAREQWAALGIAYYRAGDWCAATQALEKSVAAKGRSGATVFFYLSLASGQQGEAQKASEWYRRAANRTKEEDSQHQTPRRIQAEAAALLGLAPLNAEETPSPNK